MEKYNTTQMFKGHITAEFRVNILELFAQHFKVHNIVILSFRPNEIIVQTMSDPGMVTDIETKGLYTTTIPLQSLEEYDFECNKSEVNVMVTNALIESTCKVATGCNFINVVSDGSLKECKPLVEVSFDLYEKKRRRKGVHPKKPIIEDISEPISDDGSVSFGKLVEVPYLHYLITSRIDYSIRNYDGEDKSIVVRNPLQFKNFYGHEQRIFVTENGKILFCGCHLCPAFDSIIQSDLYGSQPKYELEYELEYEFEHEFEYELPNKPFKHLFKFMGHLETRAKPKSKPKVATQVNNFEILISEDPPEEVNEPESFNVGNITFHKCIPSCVKRHIDKQKEHLRNQLSELNFNKRDDWSNLSKHSDVLKRNMVLPKFIINCKYYSTHVLFEKIELLRKSEFMPYPFDSLLNIRRLCPLPSRSQKKPISENRYVPWRVMFIKVGFVVQSEALEGFWKAGACDLFYKYLDTKIYPYAAPLMRLFSR